MRQVSDTWQAFEICILCQQFSRRFKSSCINESVRKR